MPKSSHDILYLSKMFSKCPQSVRQYLRYFSNQICCQELSKIAQSGHTASSLNVMALESQLFVPAPPRRKSVWTPPVNERIKTFFFKKKKTFLRPPQPTLNESILTGLNLKTVGLDLRLNWVELNRLYVIVCYFWWGSSHRSVDPFATINLPPWVESQPHHLCFFNFYIRNWCYIGYWIVKRTKLNWKEAGIGLFFKKLLLLLQINKN